MEQSMVLEELRVKIEQKSAFVGVIGLGYVGLPVAVSFAMAGFRVLGVDLKAERVAKINAGISPIDGTEPGMDELVGLAVESGRFSAAVDYEGLSAADVVLIDVETPVDEDHTPRYKALKGACRQLAAVMKPGALVIVESTIAPGTIDQVVRPLLEAGSGGQMNRDFFLGACPERVMPGKLLANLRHVSRVCGGSTAETAEVMAALYRHVVDAELDLSDPLTAEMVKTTENAYRDVQIAFANEVALICEAAGADVWKVRELVNKVPFRNMHLPGAGVGGHCITKDPWLLAYGARGKVPVRLIPSAREVNDGMPQHTAELTLAALLAHGVDPARATVAVLGYAYLANSDDSRNSPSKALIRYLEAAGVQVKVHDPWVAGYQGSLAEKIAGCDTLVAMVAHDVYHDLDLAALRALVRTPIIIDGRRVFTKAEAEAAGFVFRGVGQGEAMRPVPAEARTQA